MIRSSLTMTFLLVGALIGQEPNEITFTLVTEEGFNEMAVTLDAEAITPSDDVSYLSGTLDAVLNIDEATNQTDTLTFLQADLVGSNISLTGTLALGSYSLASDGMEAGVATLAPPGVVTPATGEFDAEQHSFIVREGTLSGTASIFPIGFNFSDEPFIGTGTGTGTVVITPTGKTIDKQFYDVFFTNPIAIANTIDTGVLGIMADVTMSSTVKGAGTTFVERTAYANWAAANLNPEETPEEFSLHPEMPNGLIYALGFNTDDAPDSFFFPIESGFQLLLAETGTRENLVIECSPDLVSWEAVPNEDMLEGSSEISIGSDQLTIVNAGSEGGRYYRVRIVFD